MRGIEIFRGGQHASEWRSVCVGIGGQYASENTYLTTWTRRSCSDACETRSIEGGEKMSKIYLAKRLILPECKMNL